MIPLYQRLKQVPGQGVVRWVGVRPVHGDPMVPLDQVTAVEARGLEGDVASQAKRVGKRQVTLVQAEHLPVLGSLLGRDAVLPEELRRNVVVSGINLVALAKLRFAVGDEVILVGTGPCAPCIRMDEILGEGGFHAVRGHGGITAQIERGGVIRVGDVVRVLGDEPTSDG